MRRACLWAALLPLALVQSLRRISRMGWIADSQHQLPPGDHGWGHSNTRLVVGNASIGYRAQGAETLKPQGILRQGVVGIDNKQQDFDADKKNYLCYQAYQRPGEYGVWETARNYESHKTLVCTIGVREKGSALPQKGPRYNRHGWGSFQRGNQQDRDGLDWRPQYTYKLVHRGQSQQ